VQQLMSSCLQVRGMGFLDLYQDTLMSMHGSLTCTREFPCMSTGGQDLPREYRRGRMAQVKRRVTEPQSAAAQSVVACKSVGMVFLTYTRIHS
jgi:hypothetical protein